MKLFTLTLFLVSWMSCYLIVGVVADLGTAASYDPPYLPTRCNGYKQGEFQSRGYFVAASDGLWDNGASCGRRYRLRCLNGRRNPCRGRSIVVEVVDVCKSDPCPATFLLSNKAFDEISRFPDAKINIEFQQI
ncbi:PREDICTED: EG45-like domain containing protein [Tarenaya hassleriana]|uniref:EG45-like domain containing protein n=1 Tax=Tarenaya hassleriana TaxID=28532 RepID=UPI00053CA40F|nr:PREDICTED: EG45-like domain containing protein [Tarenaya hassleriana]